MKRALVQGVARVAPLSWNWRGQASLVVLTYHRVLPKGSAALKTEQPGMYVSPDTLDMHLSELKRRFEFAHLNDWLRRAKQGAELPKLACAITFDDGWRDNYEFALPILVRHGVPATIFLVSSYIGTMQRYWPNRLMDLLRKSFTEPGSVDFPTALANILQPLLANARARGELRPIDCDQAVQSAKTFDEAQIRRLVEASSVRSGGHGVAPDILSRQELVDMAATGLVRFGSHTMTHFRLGSEKSVEILDREIVGSRKQIRDMSGQEVDLFCYPNGETSRQAIEVVRRHYLGAVSTLKGWHVRSDDAYLIKRISLHESASGTRERFIARISGWI